MEANFNTVIVTVVFCLTILEICLIVVRSFGGYNKSPFKRNIVRVRVKKLRKNAIMPTMGSQYSAGYDLYACVEEQVVVKAGQTVKIPTGLSIELPAGYAGLIFARSGLATKVGLAPANKVGVCDSDYRGEYIVALHNHSSSDAVVSNSDRIAQLVIVPILDVKFVPALILSETERNEGGFGSTGK